MNKIVVMFPGQASQYVGMGKTYYERYESVRKRFSEASEILGFPLVDLCFNGPLDQLTRTENTQPAILALSVAMFEAAQQEGLQPSFLAGHSLGEISALTAASVFSFADAVRLARIRGEAMAACTTDVKTGMAAVTHIEASQIELVLAQLEAAAGQEVEIANYNAPTQTVLSGSAEGLQLAEERLTSLGAKVHRLNVSGPFHSQYMSSAVDKMLAAMDAMSLRSMNIPVLNGHEGRFYAPEDDIKLALARQLTGPVRWTTVISQLRDEGTELWLEMGPKDVLKKLTLQTFPEAKVFSYDHEADQAERQRAIESVLRIRQQMPNLLGLCLGVAVSTRNTNWDDGAYQKGVVEPYKEIQSMYELVVQEGRVPTQAEIERGLERLTLIMDTKGIARKEQQHRISAILRATDTDKLYPEYMAKEAH